MISYVQFYDLLNMDFIHSGAARGRANEQLPISFEDSSIVILIVKFLSMEILLFENCLFIFEYEDSCFFFLSSEFVIYSLLVPSV